MKDYKLTEVKPRIFFLNFTDHYKMCMQFLRYQEFYESPNPKFRSKPFTLVDFMEWYSKKYGNGAFTYPVDWGGFNIPASTIVDIYGLDILDPNKYDEEMALIWSRCAKKYPDHKFYIIGAVGESGALKHEIAHGFFYTRPEYKKEMTKLVKALDPKLREKIYKTLETMGYTPKVYIDECQAYMSTGVPPGFKVHAKRAQKPFIEIYDRLYNEKTNKA